MKFYPSQLRGSVTVPESKSLWHRELVMGYLAGDLPIPVNACDDVRTTYEALCALRHGEKVISCGQSGTTLRFLAVLTAALGEVGTVLLCEPSLLRRPLPLPFPVEKTAQGYRITEKCRSGAYRLAADQTSQVLSGLLTVLPVLAGDSRIMLTTPLVSHGYVDMTVALLQRHGIVIERRGNDFFIAGGQKYGTVPAQIQGDWSAACWFTLFCPEVTVKNTVLPSLQPDSAVLHYVNNLPSVTDVSQTPDLLPPLALYAAVQPGKSTRFEGAAFLRGKESDRLHAVTAALNALGALAVETPDGLEVVGAEHLRGGYVDSCGDHRIALLGAFASLLSRAPVTVSDTRCIDKSYPGFLRDFARLGGRMEEDRL